MEEECSAFSEMSSHRSFLLAPTPNQIHGDKHQYEDSKAIFTRGASSDLGYAPDYIETTKYHNPLKNTALFAANKAAERKGLFGCNFWLQIGLILILT